MIADPRAIARRTLERRAAQISNHSLVNALVKLAAQTADARALIGQWLESDDEWLGRAGWHLLGDLAMRDPNLPDSFFEPYLQRIERERSTPRKTGCVRR